MKKNEIFASLKLNKNNIDSLIDRVGEAVSNGVTGITITEEYTSDSEHETNLHMLSDLARSISVPVYAKLSKDAHEDVKKYLYAGCAGVIIDENLREIIKESSDRFLETNQNLADSKEDNIRNIKFSDLKTVNGLIPCIVQDYKDGCVLMMAYMNEESFNLTLKNKQMIYFSRSRNKLWLKGEESGHFQKLISLTTDCDMDTLLAKVDQTGVACHTGSRSCFFNDIVGKNDFTKDSDNVLNEVYEIIMDRKNNPKEGSYTNYLFDKGVDKILKKVGEETTEIVIAAKNPENKEIVYEISDLLYHLSVLMAAKDVTWDEIMEELKNR